MSEAFKRYRHLEGDLVYIRWQHAGFESEEEETILDAMEKVWYELSEVEQKLLYSEGTQSLIRDSSEKTSNSGWVDGKIQRIPDSSESVIALREVA